jgi:hypothetical protein
MSLAPRTGWGHGNARRQIFDDTAAAWRSSLVGTTLVRSS